jgi:hypothetical protein
VNTDGTLTGPVAKPWKTASASKATEKRSPELESKANFADASSEDSTWVIYGVGGGVTSLILLLCLLQPVTG